MASTTMATDDLFASLGGSLMRDILGSESNTASEDILSSLEAELDASMPPSNKVPPGLVGGAVPSAAALIVSHQQEHTNHTATSEQQPQQQRSMMIPNPMLAFDQNAVADFLREDAARKKEKEEEEEMRKEMEKVLFDEEEYDMKDPTMPPSLALQKSPPPVRPPPGVVAVVPPPPLMANLPPTRNPLPTNFHIQQHPAAAAMLPPFLQAKLSSHPPNVVPPHNHPMPPHNNAIPSKAMPPQFFPPPPPPPPSHLVAPSRFYFCNPHPNAPPLPANSIPSSLMTKRDLGYVVHAMIRPLNMLLSDPTEDYYFAMKTRVRSKRSKAPGRKELAQFRELVETRAKNWKGDQKVLGHVVKSNVHCPRAMLDFEKLLQEHREETVVEEEKDWTEEENANAHGFMWKARKLMDRGYQYLLDGHNEQLRELIQDTSHLSLLLSLPKGRTLMARSIEYSQQQHNMLTPMQVFQLFPSILSHLIGHPANTRGGEDRLLYALGSCTIVVTTDNNTLDKSAIVQYWTDSLKVVMNATKEKQTHLKKVLGSRPRAEFMHALLTTGGEMYVKGKDEEWKLAEEEFLSMLSSPMS